MAWRNGVFLCFAIAAHVVLWLLAPVARYAPPPVRIADATEIEVETPPGQGHAAALGARGVARTDAKHVGGAFFGRRAVVGPVAPGDTVTAPETEGSAAPEAPLPSILTRSDDIGLDGPGSFRIDVAKQLPDDDAVASENVRRSIMDPIHAHEAQTGDVTSGPLANALEATTRRMDGTPFEGRAVFAIEVDNLGLVVHVNVAESSGDRRAWDDVARSVLNAFAQKRLRVPPGAKRIAMQIEISSKVTLPSGARHPMSVSSPAVQALEHMAHGEFDKAPDNGTGTVPIIGGSFDLSDIGAHPQRVVGARVISQQTF